MLFKRSQRWHVDLRKVVRSLGCLKEEADRKSNLTSFHSVPSEFTVIFFLFLLIVFFNLLSNKSVKWILLIVFPFLKIPNTQF